MASFAEILLKIREEEQQRDADEMRDQDQEQADTSLMGEKPDSSGIGDGDEAANAIRSGLNLKPDFWDDFIKLTNNTDALASLLKVDEDQVAQWGALVSSALEKVKSQDQVEPDDSDSTSGKNNMMHTGGFQ